MSATRAFFLPWTEKKSRRVAEYLHCNSDGEHEAKTKYKTEPVLNKRVDILQRLQKNLEQMREELHCKGNSFLVTPDIGSETVSQQRLAW